MRAGNFHAWFNRGTCNRGQARTVWSDLWLVFMIFSVLVSLYSPLSLSGFVLTIFTMYYSLWFYRIIKVFSTLCLCSSQFLCPYTPLFLVLYLWFFPCTTLSAFIQSLKYSLPCVYALLASLYSTFSLSRFVSFYQGLLSFSHFVESRKYSPTFVHIILFLCTPHSLFPVLLIFTIYYSLFLVL